MNRTAETLRLAKRLYKGQVDKQGIDYVEYLRAVATEAGKAAGPSAWAVGMLHSAVEDGTITFTDLRHHVSEDELIAIGLLTRKEGVEYGDHIAGIAGAPGPAGKLARAVKRAALIRQLSLLTPEILENNPALADSYGAAVKVLDSVDDGEMVRG